MSKVFNCIFFLYYIISIMLLISLKRKIFICKYFSCSTNLSLTSLGLGYSRFGNVSPSSYFVFFFRLLSAAAICVSLFFCRSALRMTHVPFPSLCRHCHRQPIGNILILLLLKFKPQFGSQTGRQQSSPPVENNSHITCA